MTAVRVVAVRRTVPAMAATVVLLAACGSSGSTSSPASSSTTRRPATPSTSISTSTSSVPTSTTSSASSGAPGTVTVLKAGPAGGSGEIQLEWSGVAGATGYRVGRATTVSGPFATTADVNAATGQGPHDPDVVNLFRSATGYVYVDVPTGAAPGPRRFYRVTAYNTSGAAAPSAVVCGAPSPGVGC